MLETDKPVTRAWVLHPEIKTNRKRRAAGPALDEAVALAAALPDLEIVGSEIVPIAKVNPGTLFGSGKIAELKTRMAEADVKLVLVDGQVGPVQQRNLEEEWGIKLLDRTGLILEIFSDRAQTNEGVLQVEMAHLAYQRTRLVRAWTHLERQRGGFGFVGGPGETQKEADRRAIDDQLLALRDKLDKVVKTRALHRAGRAKVPFPMVAFVGYTNAGKSTLFNRLTGADVFAKDMLFATLDPTMRRIDLPTGDEIILSDTVGFISDLPTELVASFRATLEEVLDADLIVHVRDISHPQTKEQARDVLDILHALGVAEEAPMIEVWNKIDRMDDVQRDAMMTQADRTQDLVAVSAITGEGIDALIAEISVRLKSVTQTNVLTIPYSDGKKRSWLFAEGVVQSETPGDEGYAITVTWTPVQKDRFGAL